MKKLSDSHQEINQVLLGFRQSFLKVGAFSFVINALMLAPSIYMLQVYDRVLVSRNITTLALLTLLIIVLYALMSMLEWVRTQILVRISLQLNEQLANRVFTSAFQRNLLRQGASPAQALNDLSAIRQFLSGTGIFAFFDTPWIPIYIIVAAMLHPLLGLFCLAGATALLALAWLNEMVTRKPIAEATKYANAAGQYANNNLRNAEVIDAMGMLANIQRRWQTHQDKFLALQALASNRAGVISGISKFFRVSSQSLILGLGAWLALDNTVTAGAMIAGSILMGRAFAPIDQLIGASKQWIAARTSYNRLNDLLSVYPASEKQLQLPPPQGYLQIENVSAAPPGTNQIILRGLAFRINAGDVVCVMGPSSAGKSSLARLLVGVWKPQAGHVRLDGADIGTWDKVELGPHIGYLPQDVELFEGTIAENISRFGEANSEMIVSAAQIAGVHEMILHLPNGYGTSIGVDGCALSGGQKQRIGLARALYGMPTLIVLDEPNSNLDEVGEEALVKAILEIKSRGRTTVVISHRPSLLSVVDKILILNNGSVAAYGPRDEVMEAIRKSQSVTIAA
jgi:ATP-binding cassette subfamily C exporter for protease/lipase